MDLLCISSGKEQSDEGKESERNPCLMKRRCRIPESISVIEVLIIWILYSVASVDQAYNIDQQIPELEIQNGWFFRYCLYSQGISLKECKLTVASLIFT